MLKLALVGGPSRPAGWSRSPGTARATAAAPARRSKRAAAALCLSCVARPCQCRAHYLDWRRCSFSIPAAATRRATPSSRRHGLASPDQSPADDPNECMGERARGADREGSFVCSDARARGRALTSIESARAASAKPARSAANPSAALLRRQVRLRARVGSLACLCTRIARRALVLPGGRRRQI